MLLYYSFWKIRYFIIMCNDTYNYYVSLSKLNFHFYYFALFLLNSIVFSAFSNTISFVYIVIKTYHNANKPMYTVPMNVIRYIESLHSIICKSVSFQLKSFYQIVEARSKWTHDSAKAAVWQSIRNSIHRLLYSTASDR